MKWCRGAIHCWDQKAAPPSPPPLLWKNGFPVFFSLFLVWSLIVLFPPAQLRVWGARVGCCVILTCGRSRIANEIVVSGSSGQSRYKIIHCHPAPSKIDFSCHVVFCVEFLQLAPDTVVSVGYKRQCLRHSGNQYTSPLDFSNPPLSSHSTTCTVLSPVNWMRSHHLSHLLRCILVSFAQKLISK